MENKIGSMYELTKTFQEAIEMTDSDGVLTDKALALISESKMDITQKTENIFKVKSFLEWQIEMMTNEKSYINWKQKVHKNNVERIKKLIQMWLDTVWIETDKKGKKIQKIKTLKWSAYYTFTEDVKYNDEEIASKYKKIVKKPRFSDNFTLELLAEKCPELVEIQDIEEIDYELLKFDYERALKNEWDEWFEIPPRWITIEETKKFCTRK